MENSERAKEFKIFISFDQADRSVAEDLRTFLTKKYGKIQCDLELSYQSNDVEIRWRITDTIRRCDIFILLLSGRSRSLKGNVKPYLKWKQAEAVNFSKRIRLIFVFLEEPGIFSPDYLKAISDMTKSAHTKYCRQISPEKGKTGINYEALSGILNEIGVPPIFKPGQAYDVFLCYKSEDDAYARMVYELLTSHQLKVFFSRETLPQIGSAEFLKQINLAIDKSRHMVLVASSAAHVEAQWVSYEWLLFLAEKLAGRKDGNLVTVLAKGLQLSQLPISLRNREAIPLIPGEIERLLKYVGKHDSIDSTAINSRPKEQGPGRSETRTGAEISQNAKAERTERIEDSENASGLDDFPNISKKKIFRSLKLSEILVLEQLRGKPNVAWTAAILKQSVIGNNPDLEAKSDKIQAAIDSLLRKGYLHADSRNHLSVEQKSIDYYREAKNHSSKGAAAMEDFWKLHKKAKEGNPSAQSKLGYCYLMGQGVMRNFTEALKWLCKAMDQGDLKAKQYIDKFMDML